MTARSSEAATGSSSNARNRSSSAAAALEGRSPRPRVALTAPVASPSAASDNDGMTTTPSSFGASPPPSTSTKVHGDSSSGHYDTCLLSLVLGRKWAAPVYRLLDSAAFLSLATAAAVFAIVVGTVVAITDITHAHDKHGRLCAVSVFILPLYLQRLATMDGRRLHALFQTFEAVFVLANWLVVFPCLGRVVGLGPGSWRLLYFCLLHLATAPALLTDAARDDNLPHGAAFRGILAVAGSICVYCSWIYAFAHETVPGAFYDKPLLLREDRLAEAMGPARDVLTTRLFTLVLFSLKYLFNLVASPNNFVLLTQPVPRQRPAEHDAKQLGLERVNSVGSLLAPTTGGAGGGNGNRAVVRPL